MKSSALIAAALFLCASLAEAGEPDLSPFILLPYKFAAMECRYEGDDTEKLRAAILGAKSRSGTMLPPAFWSEVVSLVSPRTGTPHGEMTAKCHSSIRLFANPDFSIQLRGVAALMVTGPSVMKCLAFRPTDAMPLKSALVNAFKRNGFELTDNGIDESVRLTKATGAASAPTEEQCVSVFTFVSGSEFDAAYSEAGVERLLAGR